MAQLLFYIEVVHYNDKGDIFDVHLCSCGGLPILYRNEKKAKWRASSIRQQYINCGYRWIDGIPNLPYHLLHDKTGVKVTINIREVRVCV